MHELTGREKVEGRDIVLCQKKKLATVNENTAFALLEMAGRFSLVTRHIPEDGFKPAVNFLLNLQRDGFFFVIIT